MFSPQLLVIIKMSFSVELNTRLFSQRIIIIDELLVNYKKSQLH